MHFSICSAPHALFSKLVFWPDFTTKDKISHSVKSSKISSIKSPTNYMHVQNILCDNFSQANSKDVMNSQLLIVSIICLQAYILKIIEGKIKKTHEGMTPFN